MVASLFGCFSKPWSSLKISPDVVVAFFEGTELEGAIGE
jgi:hypothetical protein